MTKLANDYLAVRIASYADRVREKDRLANLGAELARRSNTPRDLLAASDNEGIFVMLATLITTDPMEGDFVRWRAVAGHVRLKHVAFRLVTALISLNDRRLIPADAIADVISALARFAEFADSPLLQLIAAARVTLVPPAAQAA